MQKYSCSSILEDIASRCYNLVRFVNVLAEQFFFLNNLVEIQFSYTFVQETGFCEGACYYDITEAKPWGCWYFIWYRCLEKTLS